VTEQPQAASRFGVWSLPTTMVLDGDGRVEAINLGIAGEHKLREQFEQVSQWAARRRISESPSRPTNPLAN